MVDVPERDRIEEGRGVGALELLRPHFAAVDGLVDARRVAGTGGEEIRGRLAERLDVAEVELVGVGDGSDRPGLAGVGRSSAGPLRAADPCDRGTGYAEAAEIGVGADRLRLPLGECGGRCAEAEEERGKARCDSWKCPHFGSIPMS